LKSSPINDWWEKFKEAVSSLPDPPIQGPVNTIEPGKAIPMGIKRPGEPFFVGTSADLRCEDRSYNDSYVKELEDELEELRKQLRDAKHNESLMARRVEMFRRRWPAIHKQFFSTGKE